MDKKKVKGETLDDRMPSATNIVKKAQKEKPQKKGQKK